jgi:hypothetical protein
MSDALMPPYPSSRPQQYPELIRTSLERYMADLAIKSPSLGAEAKVAVARLVETIEAAIQHPAELEPDEIRFGVTSLIAVGEDLPAFVNQYSLGVGWDAARVVVMGTEPAENPDVPEDMAWHAIYSVLVAADSRPEILDRIVDGSSWMAGAEGGWNSRDKRPYHLNANDFIHVERRGGSSTWKVIAKIVAPESADGWRRLLETRLGEPGLGEYAYQLDRSALPAMTSGKGQPPSPERVVFLSDALRLLRESAQVLLLHGFGGLGRWRQWWEQDQHLIRVFLGIDARDAVELDWRYVAGRNSLGELVLGDRRVLYSRALSGRIPAAYIEAVRAQVQGAVVLG